MGINMVALCEGLSAGVPEVASTKAPMFGTDEGLDEGVLPWSVSKGEDM